MQEIFSNIRQEVKNTAEGAWKVAIAQKDPMKAAELLNATTNYYSNFFTEEEVDYLRFYFNMKMEMMKE